MKSDNVFLRHILDEINFLLDGTRTLDFDKFTADEVLTRACTRSVEIIGEAVKNLSADVADRVITSGPSRSCAS
jgi:uncharacterized protein with HEPN domain